MMLDQLLHEEYEDEQGRLVLFRCRECGWVSLSLGSLHAHCVEPVDLEAVDGL